MIEKYKALILNGKHHSKEELVRLAEAYSSEIVVAGWEKKVFNFIGDWLSESPTIEIQTSGSTGEPEIMLVEKQKMIASALRTGEFLDLKPKDKALLCLPVSFIAGKMMVVRAFVLGLDLIPVNPTTNPIVENDRAYDFAAMTPMQLHYTLQTESGIEKINRIRKLIIGGGDINPILLNEIQQLKTAIWHTYGMTETLTHVAMKKVTGKFFSSHFHALPGISFSVDERDCLLIEAPWLSEKPVITNDLVDLIDKYSFDFQGRYDNIINSGGIKISPEKVESKLAEHLKDRFVILGVPDEVLGQKVVMVIEGNQKQEREIRDKIMEATLDPFEIPRAIYSIYQFPETDSGKVLRRHILDHIINRLQG